MSWSPMPGTLAVLVHPEYSGVASQLRDAQEAAPRLGVQLIIVRANTENEFNAAFSAVVQQKAAALQVCASPFFNTKREQLVLRAARHALPAIYEWREFAEAGGLMSYGHQPRRCPSSGRRLCRAHSQRRETCRPADRPIDQVRVRVQSERR